MSENDFVDLTGKQDTGKRQVRLTKEDLRVVNDNNGHLTREGCMYKVWLWAQSNNFHLLVRYLAMYKFCKNFAKSGETEDGKTILSRNQHTSKFGLKRNWLTAVHLSKKNKLGEVVVMESVEALEGFVKERLDDLRFMTAKGN